MHNKSMLNFENLKLDLHSLANPAKAKILQRFFKTSKGEYAQGDIFLGITVPQIRKLARIYLPLANFETIKKFLHSKIHEERFLALAVLVEQYKNAKTLLEKEKIYEFYTTKDNLKWINNWDLVDISCHKIIGLYLIDNPNKVKILYNYANSSDLWQKRISIVTTFAFIRQNQFDHTIKLAKILLNDKHHLIHKAVGWALREVGKKDKPILIDFLDKNHHLMPSVMLSYSLEHMTEFEKAKYRKTKSNKNIN